MLTFLYHEILYRPLLNLLVFFYNIFGDMGLAIIALTVLVRLILYPFAKQSINHQKSLKKIQPKIKELQEKHKDDKEKLTAEMMALYKEHDFNPASGCLPLIIQLPILIALYRVFIAGLHLDTTQLYSWISHPNELKDTFLGIMDLSKNGMILDLGKLFSGNIKEGIQVISWGGTFLAILAGFAQYYQAKMSFQHNKEKAETEKKDEFKESKPEDQMQEMSEMMGKQVMYIFPFLTIYIGLRFPAGLSLYWATSTILLIIQQFYLEGLEKREQKKSE